MQCEFEVEIKFSVSFEPELGRNIWEPLEAHVYVIKRPEIIDDTDVQDAVLDNDMDYYINEILEKSSVTF